MKTGTPCWLMGGAGLLFCILGLDALQAGEHRKDEFPSNLTCTVQPFYRHRADGKAGREVLLKFGGEKLRGEATIEVLAGKMRETARISAGDAGVDSTSVLLPPDIGVHAAPDISLTLRQGAHRLARTVHVPQLRHWRVFVYPHSHVDIGYSNTQQNVEFIHKRNIDQGIRLAEATRKYADDARYLWNTEVMWPFERYYTSASPVERARLVRAVRAGELCLDAAYVHVLTTSCSDEEMIQSLRAGREAAHLTGTPIDTYVQVDVPGMAWGLVEVLAHEGIRYVMMLPNGARGNDSMVTQFRRRPFWWVGEDGTSRVLFLNAGSYGAGMTKGGKTGRPWFGQRDRSKIPELIKTGNPRADFLDAQLFSELPALDQSGYPYDIYVVSWAMWDNALIDADLADAVASWNREYAYPHLVIAGAHRIMQTIEQEYGTRLPEVRGDFSEYWTDGLGAVARETRMNRNARERLVQAEKLWPMLHAGGPAPRSAFDEAWRFVVLSSEHTFCTENPNEPYFQDAIWRVKQSYFREAEDRAQTLFDDAIAPATDKSNGALGPPEGPSGGGVAVINTNSWPHGGVVKLSSAESQIGDRVVDERGNEILSQRLSTGDLAFLCPEVPAMGSRHFRVMQGHCSLSGRSRFSDTLMENSFIRVAIDRGSGNIVRLIEHATGRDFAGAGVAGGLNAFRWQPARGKGAAQPDTVRSVRLRESGPLIGEIEVVSSAPGCRSVTRRVGVIDGDPVLEITDVVDKLPLLPKDGVHFAFGFNVPDPAVRVDIPWGVMRLEKDQWPAANRAWISAQRFVDISNDSAGVTWCSPDAPLIESGSITGNNTAGWDGKGDVWPARIDPSATIYSWVMNNHWFTNSPLTQDGPVEFRYRILLHGKYDAAEANRFGMEQCQPLVAFAADKNPVGEPILRVADDRVSVSILKSTADGRATIVRLRSLSDNDEDAGLAWPARSPRSVFLCEKGEEPGKKIAGDRVVVPHMGYVTLRVEW